MEVPVSVAVLLVVVALVVAVLAFSAVPMFREENVPPVRASFPAGNPAYKADNTYYVPLRFSKGRDVIVSVCRIDLAYVDGSGQVLSATIPGASGTFKDGSLTLRVSVVDKPAIDTVLIVSFANPDYRIASVTFYYCLQGEMSPRWSETLLVPETALTP